MSGVQVADRRVDHRGLVSVPSLWLGCECRDEGGPDGFAGADDGGGPVSGPAFPKGWRAPCVGLTHLFFPPEDFESKTARDVRTVKAKSVCEECPQQLSCLEWAVTRREPWGVWGGLDEVERGLAGMKENRPGSKLRLSALLREMRAEAQEATG